MLIYTKYTKNNLASHLFLVILGLSSNNVFSAKKAVDNKDLPQEKKNSQKKELRKRKLPKTLKKLQEEAGSTGYFGAYSLPAMKKKEEDKKEYSLNTKPTNNQQQLQPKIQAGASQTHESANSNVNFENFVKNYQEWIQQQLLKNTQHDHVEVFIVTESLEDLLKKDQN